MKKVYTFITLAFLVVFTSCSKDFLKSYDKRIIGVWRITDTDRIGIGGSTGDVVFTGGTFTFYENGSLSYVDAANVQYQGNWDIVKKSRDDDQVHTLQLTAVNYATQKILTAYYDEMSFTGTNHFKTKVITTFHTYVTDFKR